MTKTAICGLDCENCGAYKAHQTNDDSLRRETAEKWAKEYNAPGIKPEDINCTGCTSLEEPLYSHCKECGVRLCGVAKGVKNCGECDQYPCDKSTEFHKYVPAAKEVCDQIHNSKKQAL